MSYLSSRRTKYKNEFYYHSYFFKYLDLEYYLKIYYKKTQSQINFPFISEIHSMKCIKKSDILKRFGKPDSKCVSKFDSNHIALFYKSKVSDYKTVKSFHFLNKSLILINICFPELTSKSKSKLLNLLSKKFTPKISDTNEMKFSDRNGQIIYIDNLYDLSVSIMPSEADVLKKIDDKMKNDQKEAIIKEEKKLIQLFSHIL